MEVTTRIALERRQRRGILGDGIYPDCVEFAGDAGKASRRKGEGNSLEVDFDGISGRLRRPTSEFDSAYSIAEPFT